MRRCIELVLATAGGDAGRGAARSLARAVAPAAHLPPARAGGPGARRRAAVARDRAVPGRHRRHRGVASRTTAGSRSTCPAGGPISGREIDLVEEIARLHGYDAFPSDLRPFRVGTLPDAPEEAATRRRSAAGWWREGFYEVVEPAAWARPTAPTASACSTRSPADDAWLRRRLLPGLVRLVEANWANQVADVRLFEIGTAFTAGAARRAAAGGAPGGRGAHRPARAGALDRHRRRRGSTSGTSRAGSRRPSLWRFRGPRCRLKGSAWVVRDRAGRVVGEGGAARRRRAALGRAAVRLRAARRPGAPPPAPPSRRCPRHRRPSGSSRCSCRRGSRRGRW